MVSLPEVTEEFSAETGPYVRGLSEAIAAAERFRDMNIEALASIELLNEAMAGEAGRAAEAAAATTAAGHAASATARDFTGLGIIQRDVADASADLMRQTTMLGGILQALEIIQKNTADSSADLMMQTQLLASATMRQADAASSAAKNEYLLAMAERLRAKAAEDATGATNRGGLALGRFGLTWNAVHWIIAGGAEVLAVAVPAAIAAAAGAFVMYQGVVEQVIPRLHSLQGATEATAAMLHTTAGDALGLGHAFQTAQNAANPVAYQLLGSYVNAARSHMVNLAGAGLQVSQAVGELAARINVDLVANGGKLTSLLNNMVPDLIQLGQVFGNLGHAVLNFAADMPGLAELLLRIADAVSRVILWVSELPAPLITAFMVFEEVNRWGGLLVGMFGRLGIASEELAAGVLNPVRTMGILSNVFKALPLAAASLTGYMGSLVGVFAKSGSAAENAGAGVIRFAGNMSKFIADMPAWQAALGALAVAGFIALAIAALRSKDATAQWIATQNQAIATAKNVDVIATIFNSVAQASQRLSDANSQLAASSHSASVNMAGVASSAHLGYAPLSQAQVAVNELTQQQQHLVSVMHNVTTGANTISRAYGVSFPAALGLADAAGVKLAGTEVILGAHANIAGQQIMNLVTGYQRMSQTGGILNNDMNALSVQAGLQITKVSQLNQAWDQFLSNVTGLTSSFAGLVTDVGQINNAITTAGTRFTTFGGKVVSSTQAAAMSLRGFSGTSAQVWQNYDQALQQAGQYTDSLRTAAAYGAVSQKAFTQQIAYTIQQLLPYARYSKTAASELSALAQQAGGPATDSYKTLKAWVDHNTESAKQFNEQMSKEVGQISDVSKAASEFASTLDSQVAAALDQAKIGTANLTGAASRLNNAYQQTHGTVSGPVISAFSGLVGSLFKVYGSTKTAVGIADAYAKSLGYNQSQVNQLNKDISSLIGKLNSIPNISRTVTVQTNWSGPIPPGIDPAHYHAAAGAAYTSQGATLVGEAGPEIVHLPAGASVTPNWQAAPLMRGEGGGGGQISLTVSSNNYIGGAKVGSSLRTQILTFNRRNSSAMWNLRTR